MQERHQRLDIVDEHVCEEAEAEPDVGQANHVPPVKPGPHVLGLLVGDALRRQYIWMTFDELLDRHIDEGIGGEEAHLETLPEEARHAAVEPLGHCVVKVPDESFTGVNIDLVTALG